MKKTLLLLPFLLACCCVVWGQVWSPKAVGVLPSNYNVSDISIVGQQVIWAVAVDYSQATPPVPARHITKLLKSVDGGDTWVVKDIEEAMGRVSWDIHAFDDNTACITTQNLGPAGGRGIFRTTEGGDTWTEVFNHVAGGVWIHFFDGQKGVCINNRNIATTTNAGLTWTLVSTPAGLTGEGTLFSSASNAIGTYGNSVWFGTTKGRLFKTTDRGQHWAVYNTGLGANSTLFTMGFTDENNGLAIYDFPGGADHEHLVRTTDGGLTWEDLGDPGIGEVDAIPCTNTFIGGYYKNTSTSVDFGDTWVKKDTLDTAGAVFLTPALGWMPKLGPVGTGPALYKWIGGSLDTRIYVNKAAAGANNGASWADAFTDLKSALAAAAPGDEIWVAQGIYRPDTAAGSPDATFLIDKNLKLYGGFAGTECYLSERNIELTPTVLSGDLNGNDLPNDLTANRTDNVMTVLTVNAGVTNETVIDGFTIANAPTYSASSRR